MAQPRVMVEAPPVRPLPFGLSSVAVVTSDLEGHAQMGTQYEPVACGDVHETRAACDAEAAEFDQSHTGVPMVYGDPFTLYSLFVCNPVGLGPEGLREKAAEALTLGESRGMEHALGARLPLVAGAVDLTPGGGAVHPVDGLAALEAWSSRYYGGVPTIHSPRGITTVLGALGAVERQSGGAVSGPHLESTQGALIASGGGYYELMGPPTDVEDPETVQEAGAGEAWMYVTGTVVIKRAPNATATPLSLSRVTEGDHLAATNDAMVLALRQYVASWECITGAILVTSPFTTSIDGGGA